MKYQHVVPGIFLKRPNRFIAQVEIEDASGKREETVHVKNTGRCRELLVPGCRVYLEKSSNPNRKTAYDLIAVEKGSLLINMDSQAPNEAAYEFLPRLLPGITFSRREVTFGDSRFDLYAKRTLPETGREEEWFIEVKGVTLENDGEVKFPDAPTQRGVKHLEELISCHKAGYCTAALFVIQMEGVKSFSPNWEMHREFGTALQKARDAGVKILAYDCTVTPDSMELRREVPVIL
jgi:sugar fermentation stimulation protein